MKKVYFAGSIRGGRADADLYRQMIEYIQQGDIVLTEHVGNLSLSKTEGQPNEHRTPISEQISSNKYPFLPTILQIYPM